MLNQLACTRLQLGDVADALELFKLNVEAYPVSANAEDIPADGYPACGETDVALAADQKYPDLLRGDKINDQLKSCPRRNAEQKLAKPRAK